MNTRYSHLADRALLRMLAEAIAGERYATSVVVALIAEVQARRLYAMEGHPSMLSYCVHVFRLSECAARKRITAAHVVHRLPAVLDALADGRLHLTAVVTLAPDLSPDTAADLIAAATHKTRFEIEQMLASLRPKPDAPTRIQTIAAEALDFSAAGETEGGCAPERIETSRSCAPERIMPRNSRSRVTPLSPGKYEVGFTMREVARDKMKYSEALLGRPAELPEIFELALDALIEKLEKQKFSATSKPRPGRGRRSKNARHIPADVKRRVWERDGGRCTFENDHGERCPAHGSVEFDHAIEVARGARRQSTIFVSAAAPTTSTRRSERSAPASWRESVETLGRRPPSAGP